MPPLGRLLASLSSNAIVENKRDLFQRTACVGQAISSKVDSLKAACLCQCIEHSFSEPHSDNHFR